MIMGFVRFLWEFFFFTALFYVAFEVPEIHVSPTYLASHWLNVLVTEVNFEIKLRSN